MCETIFCIYRISGIQIWYCPMQQNAAMPTRTHFKTQSISLVSLVQSWHVTPFFASTESHKSKSDIGLCNRTRQCALGPFLRPNLYLWCPWSNPDMWDHFLHLQNLRNPNLRLPCSTLTWSLVAMMLVGSRGAMMTGQKTADSSWTLNYRWTDNFIIWNVKLISVFGEHARLWLNRTLTDNGEMIFL